MSSNKDSLPLSSPISSICDIEIEAILFLFMMNYYKSSFPRMYYNYRIKNRAYEEPAAVLITSDTRKDGIPPPPVGLSWDSPHYPPESVWTDGRTDGSTLTSEPKFCLPCLPMVLCELRELRY